jgi:aminoglycoside phosphotransferase (APT) family kinase protein
MSSSSLASEAALQHLGGGEVIRIWPLEGGMSCKMLGVEARDPQGRLYRMVARFPSPFTRSLMTDPAGTEFQVLEMVRRGGIKAPVPIWVSQDLLLMEFLPGKATARAANPVDYAMRMADALAGIHRLDASEFGFLISTKTEWSPPAVPEAEDGIPWGEIVSALSNLPQPPWGRVVVRHGDFWPGNLLWTEGQLTGIVDWENALLGPAAADIAITRLDILWAFGPEAMEAFTIQMLAATPLKASHLVYWDLRACLRPMFNLPEWAAPYAALDRPDITYEHLKTVLIGFAEDALLRARRLRG